MKRCKTCAWWERFDKSEWGNCDLADSDSAEPVHSKSLAVAQDYESYQAHLQTNIRFGCVQWTKKE